MENPPVEEAQIEEPHTIEEGKAKIVLSKKNVFYNPVQEFNRDLSIAVLNQFTKQFSQKTSAEQPEGLRILEALAATGLRSIRYAKEVPKVREILANDFSIKAVEAMKKNITHNGVENVVLTSLEDASMVMYQNRKTKFDVVDLDPYGCPTTFLDGAVQCIKDNGLLLVTATDMGILAGNFPETCYVKYGALSLKTKSCHEMALRILLQHIASHAGRYGKVITPVLSISVDFYIRVFVKIKTSQAACKQNTSNLGFVYQCTGCDSFTIQPLGVMNQKNAHKLPQVPFVDKLCEFCKHKHHMGGPIWIGPMHDKDFVQQILNEIENEDESNLKSLKTIKRIQGILHVIHEELDVPLYYQLDRLTSIVKCNVPPMVQFRSAILNAGYKVSYSHAHKTSIKTDAPNHVLWDIVRAWENLNPVKREKFDQNSPGLAILSATSTITVDFTKQKEAVPFSQQQKLTRFQLNPSAYWGPGTRSMTMIPEDRKQSKKERNQNKKRKKEQDNSEETSEEKKRNIAEEDV